MSLVDAGLSFFPVLPMSQPIAAYGASTFDASTDLLALVFRVPKTGTISKIHYRIGAVTSPVMTHRIELRTVSLTTGQPNAAGTLYGSSSTVTVDASTYTANTNYSATVSCTGATKGDLCAAVFDLSAFTSGSFTQLDGKTTWLAPASSGSRISFPYSVTNTTGSAALDAQPLFCIALEYSGGVFVPIAPGIGFVGTGGSTTVTSTGGTRRAGNAFTPTVPRRAIGFYVQADLDGSIILKLRLQSDDSVLASSAAIATTDPDVRGSTANSLFYYAFDSDVTVSLSAGTGYYITAEGNDATGGIIYNINSGVSQAMLDCMPGGQNCFGVTHNGTAYTNLTTANAVTRYNIGLITDQEDDGTGGGTTIAGTPMLRGMI